MHLEVTNASGGYKLSFVHNFPLKKDGFFS